MCALVSKGEFKMTNENDFEENFNYFCTMILVYISAIAFLSYIIAAFFKNFQNISTFEYFIIGNFGFVWLIIMHMMYIDKTESMEIRLQCGLLCSGLFVGTPFIGWLIETFSH